jgi:hypothetical protein
LYDKVYRADVLWHAYRCCQDNDGTAGVDGQTFEDIEAYGDMTGDTAGNAGKILVGGSSDVTRYNVNGTLDTSWGGTGTVTGVSAESVAIQPDDKVVAAFSWSVARLNNDGSLDNSFGSGGIANAGLQGAISLTYSVTLEPSGDIVEGGLTKAGIAFAAARFLASEPEIGSFTASTNPVTSGGTTTLTASKITDANPGATVTQVAFYYIDGTGTKQVLGYGTADGLGNWTLTVTINLAPGTYTLYAQAEDSYGVFGDPLALSLTVQ